METFKNEVIELKIRFMETRKFCGIVLLLSACSFFLFPAPAAQAGEAEILILHTNNVTGYLFPCPT
jgi:hypothetical protein